MKIAQLINAIGVVAVAAGLTYGLYKIEEKWPTQYKTNIPVNVSVMKSYEDYNKAINDPVFKMVENSVKDKTDRKRVFAMYKIVKTQLNKKEN